MTHFSKILTLLFFLLPAFALADEPELTPEQRDEKIAELVLKLGDPSWKVREEAGRHLVEFGGDAEPALLEAMDSRDLTTAKAAAFFYPLVTNELFRATDSEILRMLLNNYEAASGVTRIRVLEVISHLPADEATSGLLRLMNTESDTSVSRYAMLLLLWNLPVEVHFPSLLNPTEASLESPAAQFCHQLQRDGKTADEVNLLPFRAGQKPWMEKRKAACDALLEKVNTFRRKRPVMEQLVKYLDMEKTCLDAILRQLDPETPPGAVSLPAGEKYDQLHYEILLQMANDLTTAQQRPQGTLTILGLSYYAADFLDRVGLPVTGDSVIKKTGGIARLNHSTVSTSSDNNEYRWTELRIGWNKKLLCRGRIDWAVAEGERLRQHSRTSEKAYVTNELADIYHSLRNDKRAGELLGDIITSKDSLKKEGLVLIGKTSEEFTSQMKYYQACEAWQEKDVPRAKTLVREAVKLWPEDTETLILAYEIGQATGDEAWIKETDERVDKLLAAFDARIRKNGGKDGLQPYDHDVHDRNVYAWLAARTYRNLAQAATYAEANVKEVPRNGSVRDTLAHIYFAAGYVDDAIRHQLQAMEDNPESLEIRRSLEVFQRDKENVEEKQK